MENPGWMVTLYFDHIRDSLSVLSIVRLINRWRVCGWWLPVASWIRLLVAGHLCWRLFRLQLRHALAIHKQVEHRLSTNVLDSFLVCCHCQIMSIYLQTNRNITAFPLFNPKTVLILWEMGRWHLTYHYGLDENNVCRNRTYLRWFLKRCPNS